MKYNYIFKNIYMKTTKIWKNEFLELKYWLYSNQQPQLVERNPLLIDIYPWIKILIQKTLLCKIIKSFYSSKSVQKVQLKINKTSLPKFGDKLNKNRSLKLLWCQWTMQAKVLLPLSQVQMLFSTLLLISWSLLQYLMIYLYNTSSTY